MRRECSRWQMFAQSLTQGSGLFELGGKRISHILDPRSGQALTELFALTEAEEVLGWLHVGTPVGAAETPDPLAQQADGEAEQTLAGYGLPIKVVVTGPFGAGKTTFVDAITGEDQVGMAIDEAGRHLRAVGRGGLLRREARLEHLLLRRHVHLAAVCAELACEPLGQHAGDGPAQRGGIASPERSAEDEFRLIEGQPNDGGLTA